MPPRKHITHNIARKDGVIATKVHGPVGRGRNDIGSSRGHIMDGVEASLRRLQTDHIVLYQIHGNDSVTPVEEPIRAFDTLVQQGKVRYIGCSNWQATWEGLPRQTKPFLHPNFSSPSIALLRGRSPDPESPSRVAPSLRSRSLIFGDEDAEDSTAPQDV